MQAICSKNLEVLRCCFLVTHRTICLFFIQFFFRTNYYAQLRDFHMVSPQVVFTLLIFLTMQSYKFYLSLSNRFKSDQHHLAWERNSSSSLGRLVLLLLLLPVGLRGISGYHPRRKWHHAVGRDHGYWYACINAGSQYWLPPDSDWY